MRKKVTNTDVNYIDINTALEQAAAVKLEVTRATMIRWVQENDLGFQPGGNNSPWWVDQEKFTNFIHRRGEECQEQ